MTQNTPNGLIVTRHAEAMRWVQQRVTQLPLAATSHLTDESWLALAAHKPTDVFGVLPLNWLARLHKEGVRCWMIELDLPPNLRGKEITAKDMEQHGAMLVGYTVQPTGHWPAAISMQTNPIPQ